VQPILQARRSEKPLAAFLTPHAEQSLQLLANQGIAAFRTPEACADAFAAYFAWRAPRKAASDLPFIRDATANAFELIGDLGIPVVEQAVVQAPRYEHPLPYPVALKRLGVEHKTETGGVVLNIRNPEELARHAHRMGAERLLVQRMASGLAEAIVGYRDDPVVGPVALLGAGGVLAELYKDFAVELAPVTEAEARAMIERVTGLALVRGYRNLPRGDLDGLARTVAALSRLALLPGRPVREAEVNPLIVKRDGVLAVDALVALKE
jgi:acyl-CoA synthetase (NDP forming)